MRRSTAVERPDDPGDGPDADPHSVAQAICLRLLTDRARTRSELDTALARRNVPDDVGAAVLDRLTELGLVDDAAFAESWVRSRQAGRGLARRALSHELRAKGVDAGVIAAAVDAVDADDEAQRARQLVDRRLPATRSLAADVRARRLVGMLARKGYSGGLAARVVREALAADRDVVAAADREALDAGRGAAGGAEVSSDYEDAIARAETSWAEVGD